MKIDLPEGKYYYGLGRRKTAVAKVRLYSGKGNVLVNGKDEKDYFGGLGEAVKKISQPLILTGNKTKFDIIAFVSGGGVIAHADAILLGSARALLSYEPELKSTLRKAGFLTRDPRSKERKKPGLKRARKAPQFSKR
ncbi:30S ribosomal protein S9 [Candidatus Microgenomates bacterium]|nr:30S ribosomal protein S9 [Candidatus Microgenomates bacterium]